MAFGHKAARQTAVLHESIVGIDYELNIIADRAGTSDRERPFWGRTGRRTRPTGASAELRKRPSAQATRPVSGLLLSMVQPPYRHPSSWSEMSISTGALLPYSPARLVL